MPFGFIRQFVDLRRYVHYEPHSGDCYCHRCFADFIVGSAQREHDKIDDEVMKYLHELGMP